MTKLPDVLAHNLNVVFCGTAAGKTSAERKAYYAGRGNQFWPTLHRVGLTPYRFKPHEFHKVLNYGIGLTDIAKHVAGMDKDLRQFDYDVDGFEERIVTYQPRYLAFNGKEAARVFLRRKSVVYGILDSVIGLSRLFVLPSTSRAARRYWDITCWEQLAALINEAGG